MRSTILPITLTLTLFGCGDCRKPYGKDKPAPPPDPAIELRRQQALATELAAATRFEGAACDVTAPMPPPPLGPVPLQLGDSLPGTQPGDETHGYLAGYLRLSGSWFEVVPAAPGIMPFARAGFEHPIVTVIVDRFVDPVVGQATPSKFVVGEIDARVVLWRDGTLACGARITAHNSDLTIVTETARDLHTTVEDPLSKARVDLVNEALRAGLAALHKPSPATAAPIVPDAHP